MTADDLHEEMLKGLFAAIDANDTDRFLKYLTEDASFRFGASPVANGSEAIHIAVDGFFASIASCRHTVPRIIVEHNVIVCEGEVTYTRHDKSEVTLPFANVFELDNNLISTYRIYTDIGPLYNLS